MNDEPDVAHQVTFGSDGSMEVEEQTESDWSDWGVHEPGPDRETKYEEPQASEFGVDDRTAVQQADTKQANLVADVEDDQQTLTGESAAGQILFGSD